MQQDPDGFSAGDSNLYRYVNNAPTNATDPSGEELLAWDGFTKDQYLTYFKNILKVPGIDAVQASSGRWVFTYNPKDTAAIQAIANGLGRPNKEYLEALIGPRAHPKNIEIYWQMTDGGKALGWLDRSTTLSEGEKFAVNGSYDFDYYTLNGFTTGQPGKIWAANASATQVIRAAKMIFDDDANWQKLITVLTASHKNVDTCKQIMANRAFYQKLINKIASGLSDHPPDFLKGIDSNSSTGIFRGSIGKGGVAYCWGLNQPNLHPVRVV